MGGLRKYVGKPNSSEPDFLDREEELKKLMVILERHTLENRPNESK